MMKKKGFYTVWILIIAITSCKDNDINLFNRTAAERVSDAIAKLKGELTAPANGWKVKYRPEATSGSYYVTMKFTDANKVTIKTDLSLDNGKYFEQTIGYRIESSLGLHLVLENYCFFSYLFEQNNATFQAEFEFDYVNKTPGNALIFKSKTDVSNATILVFEELKPADATILSKTVSTNLGTVINTIDKYSSSLKLTYDTKDLVLYLTLSELDRKATISAASRKTNTLDFQMISYSSPYVLKNDSLIFDLPISGSFLGNSISVKRIKFNTLVDAQLTPCLDPLTISTYTGVTSQNDNVTLAATIFNHDEELFKTASGIYFAELYTILDENGKNVSAQIKADLKGVLGMLVYNVTATNDLNAIGFYIQNNDGTFTIAVRKHTPTFTGNQVSFAFDPTITIFRNTTTDANVNNIDIYLNKMTDGGKTYIYKINEFAYEIYNPCNKWRFAFQIVG